MEGEKERKKERKNRKGSSTSRIVDITETFKSEPRTKRDECCEMGERTGSLVKRDVWDGARHIERKMEEKKGKGKGRHRGTK
jgi:hypothetical protein